MASQDAWLALWGLFRFVGLDSSQEVLRLFLALQNPAPKEDEEAPDGQLKLSEPEPELSLMELLLE
jgi:hypothetical protein